ncbi:MAG: hypothetical protein RSD49_08405 [Hafnia sp.]
MLELFRELTGDVLQASTQQEKSRLVILNNVSNVGAWDSKVSVAISEGDGAPEAAYKKWFGDNFYEDRSGEQVPFNLGFVQFVPYKPIAGAAVCNVIGYEGVSDEEDTRSPIRYFAIAKCLTEVYQRLAESVAQGKKVEVAVSQQFAAGGSWNWVSLLLKELAHVTGVPTTVYKIA